MWEQVHAKNVLGELHFNLFHNALLKIRFSSVYITSTATYLPISFSHAIFGCQDLGSWDTSSSSLAMIKTCLEQLLRNSYRNSHFYSFNIENGISNNSYRVVFYNANPQENGYFLSLISLTFEDRPSMKACFMQ